VSVKEDVTLELHATVNATRDEVAFACVRAASALGFHGNSTADSNEVSVKIFPGLVPDLNKVSPLVSVKFDARNDNSFALIARIVRYKTLRAKFFFIPLGPKRLRGKSLYEKFLTTLENELRAIDSGGGEITRAGGSA
jgi:hypothetical protein